jgi:RNA polymerase sigma-70 factor (ECF subfamily)
VSRVATGRRFASSYDMTSAKLFGICLRILNDRSEAEDVLQEVYLTVWNKAADFDEARASPITWLGAIARNRAIDRARSRAPSRRSEPKRVQRWPDRLMHMHVLERLSRFQAAIR